jgi:hypothetical protein
MQEQKNIAGGVKMLIVASTRATHTYATQVRIPSMKKKNLATS